MKMRLPLLFAMTAGVCLFGDVLPIRQCLAADPAQPSPFDKDDPEIAELRKLNWKVVDFDKLDARTQCTAYFALNRGLQNLGSKADARLELLIDYLDEQKLGEAYAVESGLDTAFKPVPFDDMKKVATAYLQTAAGSSKLGKEFATTTDDLLGRYLTLYEKTARREYEEGVESRLQVRSMALFLERKGKLEEFKKWATAEHKRRQDEFEKQRAEDQAAAKLASQQAAEDARAKAAIAAEERRRQQEERAAAQIAGTFPQSATPSGGNSDNYESWGDNWGCGQNYYYYGNAYRGHVRDKYQDAGQRWRTGRPSQLPARGIGRRR